MQTGFISLYISGRRIHRRIFWSKRERKEIMAHYTRLYKLGNGRATSYFELSEHSLAGIAGDGEKRQEFVEQGIAI